MESSWIANFPDSIPMRATEAQVHRRRRITPEAGHALEKLGHAIEYLADEFIQQRQQFTPRNAKLEAIQLLMRANRQVYYGCPELPTLSERLRAMLHLHPSR
jgi:hypothetical protein